MGKINVLNKQIAELIAAGEVVERPSSVIKELVENSIDAGATSVTVEIQNGGISYMRVTDNGSGIMREDIPSAFLRHATSKISGASDLDAIGTLGFRGEALASICAVSKVSLLTRAEGELSGSSYQIEGGEEIAFTDAGCPQGTTIMIRDLFYNTPARMKFLKKDTVEANAVAGVVDRIALSHPEIAVRFIRDGKEVLNTSGKGDLKQAVYAVYGKEIAEGLIPVKYSYQGIEVTGFVCKPRYCRANRAMQLFFINGRYVRSRTAAAALEEAYKGSIMVGKFPYCFLHLEISAGAVDVNVHPAKIEVRFINERPVFDSVYHGVKTALLQGDSAKVASVTVREQNPFISNVYRKPVEQTVMRMPETPVKKVEEKPIPPQSVNPVAQLLQKAKPVASLHDSKIEEPPKKIAEEPITPKWPEIPEEFIPKVEIAESEPIKEEPIPQKEEPVEVSLPVEERKEEPPVMQEKLEVKCEIFDTYIVAQYGKDKLLLIDKHAAHERMIYNRLVESAKVYAQDLLIPITVSLSKEEYSVILQNLSLLDSSGFEAEDFGNGTILIRQIPMYLERADVSDAIAEIAGLLLQNKTDITTARLDWLYHSIACRAAVKAGHESSMEEILDLARKLQEDPQIRYCPHGRPVSILMKKYDFDKQFGRV